MENFIEDATKAYIISYNTAMEMTHNPDMAMQIAACVVLSFMTLKQTQQPQIDPMTAIMMAVGQQMTQKKPDDEEENEGSKPD